MTPKTSLLDFLSKKTSLLDFLHFTLLIIFIFNITYTEFKKLHIYTEFKKLHIDSLKKKKKVGG